MSNLSIEQAIQHAEDKSLELGSCECGAQHAQPAAWLRELLAYREASKESVTPFGYVHQCDHFFTNDHGNIYKTPGGNFTRPLYAATPLAVAVPDGWQLVPTELTAVMRDAWDSAPNGEDDDLNMQNAYRAMIAAAPSVTNEP